MPELCIARIVLSRLAWLARAAAELFLIRDVPLDGVWIACRLVKSGDQIADIAPNAKALPRLDTRAEGNQRIAVQNLKCRSVQFANLEVAPVLCIVPLI